MGNRRRLVLAAVVALTVVRLWLGAHTPLLLQPDASYDDRLIADYALCLLDGSWLGAFSFVTYAKTCAASVLMALGYALGIPYGVALAALYTLACAAMALVLRKLSGSAALAIGTYVFLLFSPVMLHVENVQKLYRGGYIVCFALFVFAGYLGMHANRGEALGRMARWSGLVCVTLPVFWFLKEDSIWLLPYMAVASATTVCRIVLAWRRAGTNATLANTLARTALVLAPLAVLVATGALYRFANYRTYGVYALTDRAETGYHEVIADLMMVDDPNMETTWITRSALEKAMAASPTLGSLRTQVDTMYQKIWAGEDGEISGDIMTWSLRECVLEAGVYDKGAVEVDAFYRQIHRELSDAFASGTLPRGNGLIRLSSIAHGFTPQHAIDYYVRRLPGSLADLLAYRLNSTVAEASHEPLDGLHAMRELAGGPILWPGQDMPTDRWCHVAVRIDLALTRLYQLLAWPVLILGLAGNLALLAGTIRTRGRDGKSHPARADLILASVAGVLTAFVLVVGVLWFANFLADQKVYDYTCVAMPLVAVFECIGLWGLWQIAIRRISRQA